MSRISAGDAEPPCSLHSSAGGPGDIVNCNRVNELLSAFHDAELAPEVRQAVAAHLEGCPKCAADLADYRRLSDVAARLTRPEPPDQWAAIERQLAASSAAPRRSPSSFRLPARRLAIAASVALAAGLGAAAYYGWLSPSAVRDQHLAMNFDSFLSRFEEQPQVAEQVLLTSYNGRQVDFDEAARLLGYRPVMARGAPPGYVVDAVYVLDMPCCKCPQVICRGDDGQRVAIFEHESDQPIWFGDRPAIDATCGGTSMRIVEVDTDLLAATWSSQERRVTVVGARNVEEVAQLASYLEARGEAL
jgi:hypothetical protein